MAMETTRFHPCLLEALEGNKWRVYEIGKMAHADLEGCGTVSCDNHELTRQQCPPVYPGVVAITPAGKKTIYTASRDPFAGVNLALIPYENVSWRSTAKPPKPETPPEDDKKKGRRW